MNIIFGKENLPELTEKYTALELDTIRFLPVNQLVTAYCILEDIPILKMAQVENMKNLHENLMANYRKQDWNYCIQALEHLMGFWGAEMDTFYQSLLDRINEYSKQDPDPNWDPAISKTVIAA